MAASTELPLTFFASSAHLVRAKTRLSTNCFQILTRGTIFPISRTDEKIEEDKTNQKRSREPWKVNKHQQKPRAFRSTSMPRQTNSAYSPPPTNQSPAKRSNTHAPYVSRWIRGPLQKLLTITQVNTAKGRESARPTVSQGHFQASVCLLLIILFILSIFFLCSSFFTNEPSCVRLQSFQQRTPFAPPLRPVRPVWITRINPTNMAFSLQFLGICGCPSSTQLARVY